jgi:hypothetical protein
MFDTPSLLNYFSNAPLHHSIEADGEQIKTEWGAWETLRRFARKEPLTRQGVTAMQIVLSYPIRTLIKSCVGSAAHFTIRAVDLGSEPAIPYY